MGANDAHGRTLAAEACPDAAWLPATCSGATRVPGPTRVFAACPDAPTARCGSASPLTAVGSPPIVCGGGAAVSIATATKAVAISCADAKRWGPIASERACEVCAD
jgi:hypothetical protein